MPGVTGNMLCGMETVCIKSINAKKTDELLMSALKVARLLSQ
jgi:hypothetical protein